MYAEVRSSERTGGEGRPKSVPVYLGQVIDLEKGIFKNRKFGIFKYTIESGIDKEEVINTNLPCLNQHEKEILDFGASYILAEFSKLVGLWNLYRSLLPKFKDSLMAMVFYYIEMASSNNDAVRWLRGSYSSLLFPAAQLQSQRISELLSKLGEETVVRDFFSKYLTIMISKENQSKGILIDSTGLPNAIHFPLTALSNHNGNISQEVRLIFVIDTETGLPLFFRYNAGNIVDITTLKSTLNELSEYNISIKHAILDAGYCSEENIKELYQEKIKFLTRLPVNRKIYIDSLNQYGSEVLSDQCRYIYNNRVIGIKRIYKSLYGHRCYLYLCVDYNRRNDQLKKFTKEAIDDRLSRKKWHLYTDKMGFFAIISSEKIEPENLLPLYYTRQTIEQMFDITKNETNIIPLRCHNEDTFRGHIMLTFMATILYIMLNKKFKDNKVFTAKNALIEMKNLKCKVYSDKLLIKELTKDMREICKMIGVPVPGKISLPIRDV
jgi:hypothetical protein